MVYTKKTCHHEQCHRVVGSKVSLSSFKTSRVEEHALLQRITQKKETFVLNASGRNLWAQSQCSRSAGHLQRLSSFSDVEWRHDSLSQPSPTGMGFVGTSHNLRHRHALRNETHNQPLHPASESPPPRRHRRQCTCSARLKPIGHKHSHTHAEYQRPSRTRTLETARPLYRVPFES